MPWTPIPFGEWLPDQPVTGVRGLDVCENAIPYNENAYAFAREIAANSNSLSARCIGAFTVEDKTQVVNIFAAEATKLWRLNTAGGSFAEVTGVSLYNSATARWNFTAYGERVIATNYLNAVQSFEIGSSSAFATLNAAAPKARYCAVVGNHLMLGNLDDGADGVQPRRVRWSAFDDETDWPTAGTTTAAQKQSDFQDLVAGDAGHITGLVSNLGNADVAVFCRRGVWRGAYVGPPFIYEFNLLEGVRGCDAPGSIVSTGGLCFYWSDHGFMGFDGHTAVPIGARKIDQYFRDNVNLARLAEMFAAYDPVNKVVMWLWPSATAPSTHCDRLLCYRPEVARWSLIKQNAEAIFATMALGYTLDGLDSFNASLDAITTSLDSDVWVGGRLQVGGFTTDHRLGYFSGDVATAVFQTKEIEDDAGRRLFCNGMRPLADFDPDSAGNLGELLFRDDLYAAQGTSTPSGSSGQVTPGADGAYPFRQSARYLAGKITYSGATTFRQARGVAMNLQPEGFR